MRFLFAGPMFLIFIASQYFWLQQVGALGTKLLPSGALRRWLGRLAGMVYLVVLAYNLPWLESPGEPTRLTLRAAFLQAPFRWWVLASLLGFLAVVIFNILDRLARAVYAGYARLFLPSNPGRRGLLSPERRRFLEKTAVAVSAAPFVASAYGLLYERTDIETTHQRVKLRRLPKAFDGFRVAQLSDIHIGPFMSADEIRRCVRMVNQLKPDLVALTGDFITWDASTEGALVEALDGLQAPFGVLGCLGNHERWADTEDSLTRLFTARGVKILRHEHARLESGGEQLNLIGVDYQTRRRFGPPGDRIVGQYLEGVQALMLPDTLNILLSHNPNTFDRAAELGIDLSLAGHTHGGQVTLEFISPHLSPSRLITPYARGWFQIGESRLYVNRGIGTIGVPIRIDSPPEITLLELKRG
jgi:predicted MPP superfamily phosphohydrolase